jgi:hypothetical protein
MPGESRVVLLQDLVVREWCGGCFWHRIDTVELTTSLKK